MTAPFVYGRIATGENFTDREEETKRLIINFTNLINTIIISPRRWGKSSLVHKAAKVAMENHKDLRICFVDLFNVRDEEDFYRLYATKVIEATSSRWEEMLDNARNFLRGITPKISFKGPEQTSFDLELDFPSKNISPDEILELPEKIARDKGLKIVVCIDEFQNIGEFKDGEYLYKRLRSHWQTHNSTAYCLYGSKRHVMSELFSAYSKPFYKFGDLIFLGKIERDLLAAFFEDRFRATGKMIDPEAARLIARLVEDHPYYAQQLAQLSWLRTDMVCTEEIVGHAFDALIEQLSLLFVNQTENFTLQQINYLKAIINGETSISSGRVIAKYGISSATSASRSRKALIEKDVLDVVGKEVQFQDPVYRHWLSRHYFGQ